MILSRTINVPESEYDLILGGGQCTAPARNAVKRFLEVTGYERILLYGSLTTGKAVRACLGKRFAGFVDTATIDSVCCDDYDCVVICTSPVHAKEVVQRVAGSFLSSLPLYRLFSEEALDIRLVLETQPRSGTGYVMRNLTRCLGMGYASVFEIAGGLASGDGLIRYEPGDFDGYVVKAHFTKTLHYPQYRFVPTLFLISYFPDTYYRWARMQSSARGADKSDYYLCKDSPEWHWVKGYIPLHLRWLDYIRDKTVIRYEDLFVDFKGVMDCFERLLGRRPDFEPPRRILGRIYWTNNHKQLMDKGIWKYLKAAFSKQEAFYYSEKHREKE